MISLYCCNLRPGCSFLNPGNLRSSNAANAAFCLLSGCRSMAATSFLTAASPPVKLSASKASSIFEAVKAGSTVGSLNKSSRFPAFFTAFFSSPRTRATGFEGNSARSASSCAFRSAFRAANSFFRASSASALVVDLDPFAHPAASFRSSSAAAFASLASFAAAF